MAVAELTNTIAPITAFKIKADTSASVSSTSNEIIFVTNGTKNLNTIHEIVSVDRAKELFEAENGFKFVDGFFKNYKRAIHVLVVANVDTAIAKIGSERFDFVATTFNASADLAKWKTWADARFGAVEQNSSQVFISKADTYNNLSTLGDGQDNKHLTIFERSVPEAEPVHLGAVLGQISLSADGDPALPFQRREVKGLTPPAIENRLSFTERDVLLKKGVSTFQYDATRVFIDMVVTTYKKNSTGQPDTQFRDLNDILNASYLRRDLVLRINTKYPHHKAGDNGGNYSFNSNVITPNMVKAEAISKLGEWEGRGLIQNKDEIANSLTVVREGDRFIITMNLQLISQLRQSVGELRIQA